MVIHDKKVDRTTNGTGWVENKTLAELKELDAGQGQHIPTLEQTLDCINKKAIAFIELKGKNTAQKVAQIIQNYVANKGWSYDNFMITSFDHHELQTFIKLIPQIKACAAYKVTPLEYAQEASQYGVYGLTLLDRLINKKFIYDAHRRGLKVFLAIFDNSNENINYIKQFGFDGFYVDYPDTFKILYERTV